MAPSEKLHTLPVRGPTFWSQRVFKQNRVMLWLTAGPLCPKKGIISLKPGIFRTRNVREFSRGAYRYECSWKHVCKWHVIWRFLTSSAENLSSSAGGGRDMPSSSNADIVTILPQTRDRIPLKCYMPSKQFGSSPTVLMFRIPWRDVNTRGMTLSVTNCSHDWMWAIMHHGWTLSICHKLEWCHRVEKRHPEYWAII